MTKIMIYEDDFDDVISRYSDLTKNHDVYVYLTGSEAAIEGVFSKHLKKAGFNPLERKKENWIKNPPEADVYFIDGMSGRCFEILKNLPKNKAYLNSLNYSLEQKAIEKGYQIVTGDLETIIQKTLSK